MVARMAYRSWMPWLAVAALVAAAPARPAEAPAAVSAAPGDAGAALGGEAAPGDAGAALGGEAAPGDGGEVAIVEHLGGTVPLNAVFRDEAGRPVTLGSLIDRPTILVPVYYRCPGVCSPLMSGLVEVLEKVNRVPGRDYRIISLSFAETETPALAAAKKANYLAAFRKPFPAGAWRFLTGTKVPIRAVTEAVGFRYQLVDGEYAHPAVLIFLSPKGRIVRYMSGLTFLPFDVAMALLEAAAGRISPSIRGALLYCYRYDPQRQTYAFNILRVAGTSTAAGVFLVVGALTWVSARRRRRG